MVFQPRIVIGQQLAVPWVFSLADICKHVTTCVPELLQKEKSCTTVLQLLVSPRQSTINVACNHGLIKARVPGKQNDLRKRHPDNHFAFSQISYMMEMSVMYKEEWAVIFCDDMNKVNVGSLVVSWYHEIGKFCQVDDCPQHQDHNFSYQNSKIISSGYMILTRKCSGTGNLTLSS